MSTREMNYAVPLSRRQFEHASHRTFLEGVRDIVEDIVKTDSQELR